MAEDEHPDTTVVKEPDATSQSANLGKTKKDKEKALKNGELHDLLVAKQDLFIAKINRKKGMKKAKQKAWREWHGDFMRGNDAEQI